LEALQCRLSKYLFVRKGYHSIEVYSSTPNYHFPRPILLVASKFLIILLLTSKSAMMPCPCGLSREMVFDLDKRDRIPLVGGRCQNPLADGSDGICGKALGAHPLEQGNYC
jgi:hypothetical protein